MSASDASLATYEPLSSANPNPLFTGHLNFEEKNPYDARKGNHMAAYAIRSVNAADFFTSHVKAQALAEERQRQAEEKTFMGRVEKAIAPKDRSDYEGTGDEDGDDGSASASEERDPNQVFHWNP